MARVAEIGLRCVVKASCHHEIAMSYAKGWSIGKAYNSNEMSVAVDNVAIQRHVTWVEILNHLLRLWYLLHIVRVR